MKNSYSIFSFRTSLVLAMFGFFVSCGTTQPEAYRMAQYINNGELDKAIPVANTAVRNNPADAKVQYIRTWALSERIKTQDSVETASLIPGFLRAYKQTAVFYASDLTSSNMDRLEELRLSTALSEYNKGVQKAAKDSSLWNQAIDHFDNALQIMPDSTRWNEHKAEIYAQRGQYEKAIYVYQRLLSSGSSNSNAVKYNLASLYLRNGQTQEAIPLLEELIEAGASNLQDGLMSVYFTRKDFNSLEKLLSGRALFRRTSNELLLIAHIAYLRCTSLDFLDKTQSFFDEFQLQKLALPKEMPAERFSYVRAMETALAFAKNKDPNNPALHETTAILYQNLGTWFMKESGYEREFYLEEPVPPNAAYYYEKSLAPMYKALPKLKDSQLAEKNINMIVTILDLSEEEINDLRTKR